jgi:hypothetical protein
MHSRLNLPFLARSVVVGLLLTGLIWLVHA